MDDCVGHVHPLHTFTNEFLTRKDHAFVARVAERLASCEQKRRTGFIRPAMIPVLMAVHSAIISGQIQGAFLFSNNDNHSLVLFVKQLLEEMTKQILQNSQGGIPTSPSLFRMAISVQSPERGRRTGIKDWESITACLKYHGLPLPTSHADLLFFDDKEHALTKEIPHYTVVPVYQHPMELEDFLKCVHAIPEPPSRWNAWMASRIRTRVHTPDRVPVDDVGTPVFLGAIQKFLDDRKVNTSHTKKTQKTQKTKRAKRARRTTKTLRRAFENRRLL